MYWSVSWLLSALRECTLRYLHSESAHSVIYTQRVHTLLSALRECTLCYLHSKSAHSVICTQRVHSLLSALKECTLCYLHSKSAHFVICTQRVNTLLSVLKEYALSYSLLTRVLYSHLGLIHSFIRTRNLCSVGSYYFTWPAFNTAIWTH